MSINTKTKFYYGHVVDETNNLLNFSEGGPEITVEIIPGNYSLENFALQIQKALNDSSITPLTYSVVVDRLTRKLTILAATNFELLPVTGSNADSSILPLAGFTTDRSGSNSYIADVESGKEYKPQFLLQSYIGPNDLRDAVSESVNISSNGNVESITYGIAKYYEFEISYINNNAQSYGSPWDNDLTAVENARDFFQYLITKGQFEIMPDRDDPNTFNTVIAEKTSESQNATGYRLKELYDRKLPGFYNSGLLKLRVIE